VSRHLTKTIDPKGGCDLPYPRPSNFAEALYGTAPSGRTAAKENTDI
jgi:hypothetical protein